MEVKIIGTPTVIKWWVLNLNVHNMKKRKLEVIFEDKWRCPNLKCNKICERYKYCSIGCSQSYNPQNINMKTLTTWLTYLTSHLHKDRKTTRKQVNSTVRLNTLQQQYPNESKNSGKKKIDSLNT
jgi:hypothetical protein